MPYKSKESQHANELISHGLYNVSTSDWIASQAATQLVQSVDAPSFSRGEAGDHKERFEAMLKKAARSKK